MRTEAIVHRHNDARRNGVSDSFRSRCVHGIVSADGKQQRIAVLHRGKLRVIELMTEVSRVDDRQSLGAQNVHFVPAAQRALLFIVEGVHSPDGKGALLSVTQQRHRRRKAVVAVLMRAEHRMRADAQLRIGFHIIRIQHDAIPAAFKQKAGVSEPGYCHALIPPFCRSPPSVR